MQPSERKEIRVPSGDFTDPEWQESNSRVQEMLDGLSEVDRERFMEQRRVVLANLGIPEDEGPLVAAGFVVPPEMWSDEDREAAIALGRVLAARYGW